MRRVAFVVSAISDEKLKGLKRDASRVYMSLTDPEIGGCSSNSPSPLIGCQTQSDFNKELSSILKDWKISDQLIFYFSGHGCIRRNQYCLRLAETTNNVGIEDFIIFDNFINTLNSFDVQKAILIIDACHSGAAISGVKDLGDEFYAAIQSNIPKGIVILASSRSTQKSHELKNGSNGVFTELLCRGLESGLDGKPTNNGLIAIDDIVTYINDKLKGEEYSDFKQRSVFSVDNAEEGIWIAKNKSGELPSNLIPPINEHVYFPGELKILYGQTSWSDYPCAEANIDDLDWEIVRQYFKTVYTDSDPKKLSQGSILSSLQLYAPIPVGGKKVLRRSAVLCFHKRPETIFSQARSVLLIGNSRDSSFIREEINGSLVYQVTSLLERIKIRLDNLSFISENGTRQEIEEIDFEVIRELISNAVTHRNYELNSTIKITLTSEALEIQSPGKFPSETSWELFLQSSSPTSNPVNKELAKYLTSLLVFESIGRGFDIFKKYIEKNGLDSISFNELLGSVTCIKVKRRINAYWNHDTPSLPMLQMSEKPWEDDAWKSSYQPQVGTKIPDHIRIGNYLVDCINPETHQKTSRIKVPAMIPVRAIKTSGNTRLPGHIIIFSNTRTRDTAIQLLESIATRLISTFPVRTLKGSFIDPIALGNTFPFKGLPKSILSGQQIFTRNQNIREELKTLVTHVEQVIQNCLGRSYETLEDYNADSQSIAEPYRYLFIADFPTAFDSNTADELKSLITNGGRAGVYSIIHVDTSRDKLRDFDYELFDQYCTVIDPTDRYHEGNQLFELKMPNGWKRDLLLDRPPTQEFHQHMIQAITKVEKTIKIETVDFKNLYPEIPWQSNSQQELRAPIGLTGTRERIEFWLGENDEKITVSSGLLAGRPGAGKSYTLHSIILSLAMQYSPAELELYLLDYKEGVEFQIYVDPNRSETQNPTRELDETRALPHAKVISIESDREFGLSVLQSVQRELEARGQLFKDVGVSELKDYRQKTGKQIPRVLVVIDEFQYMFQENDAITRDLNQLYEDITRRGRSFGVHLLLASQSLNINNINNRIYGFIPLRMAMQMDQTTANIVLAEGNTDAVELLDRSGRIIYNTEFGRKRQNQLGQIADVSLEARRNAMNHIHTQTQETNYQRPEPIVIFQGNRPSKITQNNQLLQLSRLDHWLPSSQLNKQIIHNSDWLAPEVPSALWIGEAMRIGHHTHAILRRRARSNMLLIGQSESSIFGMISGALLSLVHIHPQAEFHIIDLSQTDDNDTLSELTHTFQTAFQTLYPIKLGKRFPNSTQSIKRAEKILEELHATLQTRKQIRDADPDTMDFGPSIFFIAAIGSLSRAQYLRPIAGPRNADEMSPNAKQLQELITLGPELGIHTLLWLDNATTFQQLCANNAPRTLLSQFDCRAVLTLSAEDSRFFLGETIAQTLLTLRGYFYDASLSSGYEKFKPYAIPTPTEITQTAEKLHQRPR